MIAEENLSIFEIPEFSFLNNWELLLIQSLMKQTVSVFKDYISSDFYIKNKLNEDDYSQIYIEQAQILIRKYDYPFNINSQYRDIYNLSKGFSDFYFYPNEQGISTSSIYSVESKRLPSPDKKREREYVIGDKNNGGIERYKTEKHGKGLSNCGLLGFIEKETSGHWLTSINGWIEDLSKSDMAWYDDEILMEKENNINYSCFNSIAHRISNKDILLHHLWIIVN